MIGMIYRGNGARGLLSYIAGKDDALLIDRNTAGTTPREIAHEIGLVRQQYRRDRQPKTPVVHLTLRAYPGEDLTNEQWIEAARTVLDRLGYTDTPYAAYLHDHGEGRHLHIATLRIRYDGRLVSDSNDRHRVAAVSEELSRRFGLRLAPSVGRSQVTRAELERLARDPSRAALKDHLRQRIDAAASRQNHLRGFLTALHRDGIVTELKVASKTGQIQGFKIILPGGQAIKGSDLGKQYSLAAIAARHDLRIDTKPDSPFARLEDLTHNELLILRDTGLAPDLVEKTGSRYLAYWTLPPGVEREFSDFLALRVPHRFLTFPESLPAAVPSPPPHEERVRALELWTSLKRTITPGDLDEQIRARPHADTYAPLTLSPQTFTESEHRSPRDSRHDFLAKAAELNDVSSSLIPALNGPPAEAAALRARYHEIQQALLSPKAQAQPYSEEIAALRADLFKAIAEDDHPAADAARERYDGFARTLPQSVNPDLLPASSESQTFSEIIALRERPDIDDDLRRLGFKAPEDQELLRFAARDVAAAVEATRRNILPRVESRDEILKDANRATTSWRLTNGLSLDNYALNPTEPNFARMLLVERAARFLDFPPPVPPTPPEALKRALATQGQALLAAKDRWDADPTDDAAETHYTRQRLAYETIAERLERYPSRHPAPAPADSRDLLAAQIAYLAEPTEANQRSWQQARTAFRLPETLLPTQSAVKDAAIVERSLTAQYVSSRSSLRESEARFFQNPTDPLAQEAWTRHLLQFHQDRQALSSARAQQTAVHRDEAIFTAQSLQLAERRYILNPNPDTARVWRHTLEAHAAAAAQYERSRSQPKLSEKREPPDRQLLPRPQQELRYGTDAAIRALERNFRGLAPSAARIAERTARRVVSSTPGGRYVLAALNPVRAAVSLVPGGGVAVAAYDVSRATVTTARQAYRIFLEARAAQETFRGRATGSLLTQGNLSSHALARATLKYRIQIPPAVRPQTLRDAIQTSRNAEAALIRGLRSFRRGQIGEKALSQLGAQTLALRAAVTDRVLTAANLTPLRHLTAALGDPAKALSTWITSLSQAGLSSRAIALAALEAAPLATANIVVPLAPSATRHAFRAVIGQLRSNFEEVLSEQNEHRR